MIEYKKHNDFNKNIIKKSGIKGLVLVGGKSTRMGKNKAELDYFGKPQKEVLKEVLEDNGLETFYSVQKSEYGTKNEISDTFLNLGPFGGIVSAFQNKPDSAWLVLATDVPFVNNELIKLLIQKRNPNKVATAIKGKNKPYVEPLIAIYEPKVFPILLKYLEEGVHSPRKILMNADIEIIEADDNLIKNVNTPEEFIDAKDILKKARRT
jgi:molybdopterin-guanine dinucleotide biosynthesis protein A